LRGETAAVRPREEAVHAGERARSGRKPLAYGRSAVYKPRRTEVGEACAYRFSALGEPDVPETLAISARNRPRVPYFCGTPAFCRELSGLSAGWSSEVDDPVCELVGAVGSNGVDERGPSRRAT
jgi:hypothetical protein